MHELATSVYQIRDPNNIDIRIFFKKSADKKNEKKILFLTGARACNDSLSDPRSHQRKDFASLPSGVVSEIHVDVVIVIVIVFVIVILTLLFCFPSLRCCLRK